MANPEIERLARLQPIVNEPDFFSGLKRFCEVFGCRHATYQLLQNEGLPIDAPFVRSTYSASWIGHYVMNRYSEIDPVILKGFSESKPFFWSDIDRSQPRIQDFFADSTRHGVGECGYAIPIIDKAGRRALFVVNGEEDGPDGDAAFRARITGELPFLADAAIAFHSRALGEIGVTDSRPLLSPREVECLEWTAAGKDAHTISDILGLSGFTVRDYLKSAKSKLGCSSIPQAIYEATRLRIIDPRRKREGE
jgi:DNA-binding CsgD family transcriptional regulator